MAIAYLYPVLTRVGESVDVSVIALPFELDYLLHVNNASYLFLAEIARLQYFVRARSLFKRPVKGVIAHTSIRYRREVRVFERVTVKTRTLGFRGRDQYQEQRMVDATGRTRCHILTRVTLLDKSIDWHNDILKQEFKEDPSDTVMIQSLMDAAEVSRQALLNETKDA